MSKCEPLLSDERLDALCREAGEPVDQPEYCGGPGLYSARRVRDHYESLIDSGKLRVVEEVELWHPSVPEEHWRKWLTGSQAEFFMLVTRCCSRNPWTPPWLMGRPEWDKEANDVTYPHRKYVCLGCGNPIKR